jgi:hypothetical protein
MGIGDAVLADGSQHHAGKFIMTLTTSDERVWSTGRHHQSVSVATLDRLDGDSAVFHP